MTATLRIPAIAGLISLLAVPGPAADSRTESEILDMLTDFAASAETLDFDRMLDFYSDDDRFHWFEDGRLAYEDKETVGQHLEQLAPLIDSIEFDIVEPRVLPLSEETALVSMHFRETLTWVAGGSLRLEGVISVLVERTDAGWRFLAGHTSTTTPSGPDRET